jgi:phospholipid/cholesterol/gamma-HCH transport system substrate-binding protein
MRKEIQLGLFVLAGIFAIAAGIMSIKSIHVGGGFRIKVLYDNVGGLQEKAWVRISGVDVGRIESIALGEQQKAVVTVWLDKGIKLRSDIKAKIVASGLLGVKYMELVMVSDTAPFLKNGDSIIGTTSIGLDEVLNKVSAENGLIDSLAGSAKNIKLLTDRINGNFNDSKVKGLVDNLDMTLEKLKKMSSDLSEIVGDEKDNIKGIIAKIKSISEKIDKLVSNLESGKGMVGKIMSDEEMGADLKETVKSLKVTAGEATHVLGRFTLFKTYWNYRQRYDTVTSKYKSDIGLEIRPRPEKFYYIGVNNLTSITATGNDEPDNTFNLNIGRDFGPLTVYAGFIRSKGGIGIGFRPLWKLEKLNKLELNGEIYDFERQTPAQARINVGAKVKVSQYVGLGGSAEDIGYTNDFHLFGNLEFADEDIAYLLGFTGLIPK